MTRLVMRKDKDKKLNSKAETKDGFHGEYRFLSNFAPSPITGSVCGEKHVFASGEHIYQAFKVEAVDASTDIRKELVKQFAEASTAGLAKRLGRTVPINVSLWNSLSTVCMWETISLKFRQNAVLGQKLKDTDGVTLVEYNSWGDKIWGVDENTHIGENRLGILLMRLRGELILEERSADTATLF